MTLRVIGNSLVSVPSVSPIQHSAESTMTMEVLAETTGADVSWIPTVVESDDVESDDVESEDDASTLPTDSVAVITGVYHIVTLEKSYGRAPGSDMDSPNSQVQEIIDANASARKRGWIISYESEPMLRKWENAKGKIENILTRFDRSGDKVNGWTYSIRIRVECKPKTLRNTLGGEFDNIVAVMDQKARLPKNRWQVAAIDGRPYIPRSIESVAADPNESLGYAPFELPDFDTWKAAFEGLYGVDDYIEIIYRALQAAEASNWTQRVNILLYGPPACGKTELCKRVKRVLGVYVVLEFDATSTTMAGAQGELAEREEMPRVLIVEELEKATEASLPWLLSILDLRGEIRKKTARSEIMKSVHMISIATVNDDVLFAKLAAGALSSRYSLQLKLERPTREILWHILTREIPLGGGDLAWVEPALDFAESIGLTDPRKIIAITMTGREKLMDGSYQSMILRTMGGVAKQTVARAFEA